MSGIHWGENKLIMNIDLRSSSVSSSSVPRPADDIVLDRCSDCGAIIEHYAHDEIGLCIVALATYIHREPSLAAPIMPDILRVVAKIAQQYFYSWQSERFVRT